MDNSKIAHHISENFNKELEDIRNKVLTMGGLVEQQIEQSIHALTSGDIELAELVIRQDASIIRQLITQMMEDPRNITRMLDMLWTVRALERIGDHSRYICEHLIYMVKGEDVRHLSQEELEKIMSK